jgi:hypothetical protein
VHWPSRVYQLESSDGSASTQGVESASLGVGTAERSAETASIAVAATGHNLLSGLLDGTGLPAVR